MDRKLQPSRKGKRAWRKNIDVADITAAMEARRENEVLHGDDAGFVIDTEAGPAAPVKVLKTAEILANKSKVPAVAARKTKHKVSKERAAKLMTLAGRLATQTKLHARSERDGVVRAAAKDVWADEPELDLPDEYKKTAYTSYTAPKKAPATLSHKPIALHNERAAEPAVDAGKSYNPTLDSWKKLIDREHGLESEHEAKRQAMLEHQERIQFLIATLDDEEVQDGDEVDDDDEAEAAVDDDDKYKLSLNKRTEVKIKTRTKRNREARHKEQEKLHAQLRELRKKLHDLSRLEDIEQEVEAKLAEPKAGGPRKFARHGKHDVTFKPIEVKLSDELTNDLRSLKPEGNLLYDQMHKLQTLGKVESRVPVNMSRRYKQKFTEKWSYKDFK